MADLDKLTDDLTTKAALAAGKNAAKRAVESLLSSDEEKAKQEAERAAKSKSGRNKLIAYGVVGLLILVGLFGMLVSYWQWFLLLGLLSAGGLYGWYRLRKRFRAKKDGDSEANEAAAKRGTSQLRVSDDESDNATHDRQQARVRPQDLAEQRAQQAAAREQASAVEEREIEDELAAMKARLDK